jgi:hypothetical protein
VMPVLDTARRGGHGDRVTGFEWRGVADGHS